MGCHTTQETKGKGRQVGKQVGLGWERGRGERGGERGECGCRRSQPGESRVVESADGIWHLTSDSWDTIPAQDGCIRIFEDLDLSTQHSNIASPHSPLPSLRFMNKEVRVAKCGC
jgi:hypothetical protein